ncbi:hypothetical protein GCM10010350_45130 [Streptomyces galilaeus]|nr:hypothetical protein GCM10010350_45130 [Streptomyces galilaeus]
MSAGLGSGLGDRHELPEQGVRGVTGGSNPEEIPGNEGLDHWPLRLLTLDRMGKANVKGRGTPRTNGSGGEVAERVVQGFVHACGSPSRPDG